MSLLNVTLASLAILMATNLSHATPSTPRDTFLYAIRQVETGDNPAKVGRHGELGAYQFRRATWEQHTTTPFAWARNPIAAMTVAEAHYEWLKARLRLAGVSPTPYRLALAWNAGVSAAIHRHPPKASVDYANRVDNLYHDTR